MKEFADFDFIAGEILPVNKPIGWTSFDVVNKFRYALKRYRGIQKIKIGHAGTLDPLASGLLIVCTGKKTKEIDQFQLMDKTYSGVIRLGATTPSFDLETEVDALFPYEHVSEESIVSTLQKFTGVIQQIPPVYSAIKIDGKRAYLYARKDEPVEVKPREVTVYSFDLESYKPPDVSFRVVCSKGTYIRSLARDLGLALHTGAHLVSLRRDQIGQFKLENAYELEELLKLLLVKPVESNA